MVRRADRQRSLVEVLLADADKLWDSTLRQIDALLDQILCHEEERIVARDNTITLDGLLLQTDKRRGRRTCAGRPKRNERGGGIGRGPAKRGVEARREPLGQIAIGRGDGADAGDAEPLTRRSCKGAAAAGLGTGQIMCFLHRPDLILDSSVVAGVPGGAMQTEFVWAVYLWRRSLSQAPGSAAAPLVCPLF